MRGAPGLRRPARLLALAGALILCACGGRGAQTQGDDDGSLPPAGEAVTPEAAAPADEGAPPAAPGGAPQRLTPEQDSIQEARLYEHRRQSMESYDSCVLKAHDVDPAARKVIEEACARAHH